MKTRSIILALGGVVLVSLAFAIITYHENKNVRLVDEDTSGEMKIEMPQVQQSSKVNEDNLTNRSLGGNTNSIKVDRLNTKISPPSLASEWAQRAMVAENLADLLSQADSALGSEKGALHSLEFFALDSCKKLPTEEVRLKLKEIGVKPDPSREWVDEALRIRCVDVLSRLSSIYAARKARGEVMSPERSPVFYARRTSKDAAAEVALKHLSQQEDIHPMRESAILYREYNQVPDSKIFGASANILGDPEKHQAIDFASRMTVCQTLNSCGPNSLLTLNYCQRYGCLPGSTFQDALRQTLSQRDQQAVFSAAAWMQQFRARRPPGG